MSAAKIDTRALLGGVDLAELVGRYVSLKKNGAEFEGCCPFHTEKSPSFKVNPAKQFYHCFGCGAHGDAIKFLQDYRGLSFVDACRELGARIDEAPLVAPSVPARRESAREDRAVSEWLPVPVPDSAPAPHAAHVKRGFPERVWCYRDAAGAVLGYVYRFKTSGGGKEVLPLTWCRHAETGAMEWRWMSFAVPRPLYGLDRLAARPDATVLLVEGEKCAEAAADELPELVVMSWPGGGKAVKKVDWSPLAGRKVLLWPDADAKRVPLSAEERAAGVALADKPLLPEVEQPGVKTMAQVAEVLLAQGCRVWRVAIPAPGVREDGWDVADAIDEGMRATELADYVRGRLTPLAAALQGGEGIPPPEQAAPAEEFDDWRRSLLRKDGRLIDCRENVYMMLKCHSSWSGVLWADEFSRRVVKRKPAPWDEAEGFCEGDEWGEDDDLRLGLWLAQQEGLLVRATENLASAVGWMARERSWHPVRAYLDGLSWDGVDRLDHWLVDFLGVRPSDYVRLAGRFFLIGMVARIYRPGCPMRSMPILEGRQWRGKSAALRILGGKWYGDTPIDLNNKDSYQLIQGRWLYEIAELDAFSRAESTRIKAFISSQEDRFRAPYDRAPKEMPRQTVFAGTTNQDEYFKDQTGNTRYWPLRCDEEAPINLGGLEAVRDQLFAEAVHRFMAGERWHPTRDEQRTLFEPEQVDREVIDPWQPIIARWLAAGTVSRVYLADVLCDCLKIEPGRIDSARQMSTRVGLVMHRLGWKKKRETGGSREYYYARPQGGLGVGSAVKSDGGNDEPF